MATITFGGLSSGLDTDSIISALVDVKTQQLVTPLQTRAAEITSRQVALATFQSQMSTLKSSASSLKDITAVKRSATSSDTSFVSIDSTDDDAVTGSYDVVVSALATLDRVYFDGEADKDTTTFGTGTISITSNSVTKNVVIDSTNNTLQGIADAINATDGIEVQASIVNDGGANPYRLVLTSKATGTVADITHNIDTTLTGLAVDAGLTGSNNAVDASITVNSLSVTQSTNTFTDVIPGVKFTINDKDATKTIKVEVSSDTSAIKSALSSFVSNYNSLNSSYRSQFTYSESSNSLGVLGTDFVLQNTQSRIKGLTFDVRLNLGLTKYNSLSKLGISVDKNGVMSLDTSKLDTALADKPKEVETLFKGTSTVDGIFTKLYDYLESLTNTTSGVLTKKSEGYDSQLDSLNDLIETRQDRIDAYEESLKERFTYLEEVLADLKAMEQTIQNFSDQLSKKK